MFVGIAGMALGRVYRARSGFCILSLVFGGLLIPSPPGAAAARQHLHQRSLYIKKITGAHGAT